MNRHIPARTARLLRAVLLLGIPLMALLAVPLEGSAQPTGTQRAAANSKPLWTDLTPAQQQALSPLAAEWDDLEAVRKNKWLAIANKFSTMKPEEQQRMQERMRDWVKLTPEQRRLARENYVRARKLKPDEKAAQWEQYRQLPEEERKKLAAESAARKKVATLPRPGSQERQAKPLPPIKSTPKPVLEQSVTPKGASQSALQPAVPTNPKP